jgi:hypothetical protein
MLNALYFASSAADKGHERPGFHGSFPMSNTILNLRVWCIHFQIIRDRPWFRVSYNDYHRGRGSRFVELY